MSLVGNLMFFSGAVVFVKALGTLTTFLIARFLAPADYGFWSTVLLIPAYTPILMLGTAEAMLKQTPFYIGKGVPHNALILERNVLGFSLAVHLILLVGGITIHRYAFSTPARLRLAVDGMIVAASITGLGSFYYFRLMARQHFREVSLIDSIRAILLFITMPILSYFFKVKGAVASFLITETCLLLIGHGYSRRMIKNGFPIFDMSRIVSAIGMGLPISLTWWIIILESTAGQMVIVKGLGPAEAGYYGLGVRILGIMLLIPVAVSRVLYPRIIQAAGAGAPIEAVDRLVFAPARQLGLFLPILIAAMVFFAPYLIGQLFPQYVPGILSSQLLFLGGYFRCIVGSTLNFLIAKGDTRRVLIFSVASLVVNVGTSVLVLYTGNGIEAVACCSGVSSLLFALLIHLHACRHMGLLFETRVKHFFSFLAPFAILCAGIFLTNSFDELTGRANSFASAFVRFSFFFLFYGIVVLCLGPMRAIFVESKELIAQVLSRRGFRAL